MYAFVGESPERVHDLHRVFGEEGSEAFPILTDLFGAKGDDLWREVRTEEDSGRTIDLGSYFFEEYHLNAEEVGQSLIRFISNRAKSLGVEASDNAIIGNGAKIALPPEGFYGGAKVRRPYTESFIHGDLNARNVLISDDGRVRLIDFRYAALGPLATDFAALEASIRIRDGQPSPSAKDLFALVKEEKRILSESWKTEGCRSSLQERPYWAKVSEHLVSQARRAGPQMERQEYIATCLLYALRIGRVNDLDEVKKMRLIPWIAALYGALGK